MTFEYYGWSYFKIASTPCIFFPVKGARQVLIYSHANHEDMWREHTVLAKFATSLNIADKSLPDIEMQIRQCYDDKAKKDKQEKRRLEKAAKDGQGAGAGASSAA